jgi:hypothetical protein
MKKIDKVLLAIGSVFILIDVVALINWQFLQDVWVVRLTPIEAVTHLKDGSAIFFLHKATIGRYLEIKSAIESYYVLWPLFLVGIISGAISGYITGHLKGCKKGYNDGFSEGAPERESIEFAKKSLKHSTELVQLAEKKESNATSMLSKSRDLDAQSKQRDADSAKASKEARQKSDEADRKMADAKRQLREVSSKEKELTKAKAKIIRLTTKLSRYEEDENND